MANYTLMEFFTSANMLLSALKDRNNIVSKRDNSGIVLLSQRLHAILVFGYGVGEVKINSLKYFLYLFSVTNSQGPGCYLFAIPLLSKKYL